MPSARLTVVCFSNQANLSYTTNVTRVPVKHAQEVRSETTVKPRESFMGPRMRDGRRNRTMMGARQRRVDLQRISMIRVHRRVVHAPVCASGWPGTGTSCITRQVSTRSRHDWIRRIGLITRWVRVRTGGRRHAPACYRQSSMHDQASPPAVSSARMPSLLSFRIP
jgi:hypothetical protein